MEEVVPDGVRQLLQYGVEHPVVEREVAVRVCVDEPARQGGLRAGQLALDCVLGQDGDGLFAEGPVPLERLRLESGRGKETEAISDR